MSKKMIALVIATMLTLSGCAGATPQPLMIDPSAPVETLISKIAEHHAETTTKLEESKAEAERIAAEKAAKAKAKAEAEAKAKAEAERIEAERVEAERVEAERVAEQERVQREEAERIEAERIAALPKTYTFSPTGFCDRECINNRGEQATVDNNTTSTITWERGSYIGGHNHHIGNEVLALRVGDFVVITQGVMAGTYEVIEVTQINFGVDDYDSVPFTTGFAISTCEWDHPTSNTARWVNLAKL